VVLAKPYWGSNMAIVVPIKRPSPTSATPQAAPPDPNYLLMAAAQMHSEGRLIQKPNGNK